MNNSHYPWAKPVTLNKCLNMFNRKSDFSDFLNPKSITIQLTSIEDEEHFKESVTKLVGDIKVNSDIDWDDRTDEEFLQNNLDENIITSVFLTNLYTDANNHFSRWDFIECYRRRQIEGKRTILIVACEKNFSMPDFIMYEPSIFVVRDWESNETYMLIRGDGRI